MTNETLTKRPKTPVTDHELVTCETNYRRNDHKLHQVLTLLTLLGRPSSLPLSQWQRRRKYVTFGSVDDNRHRQLCTTIVLRRIRFQLIDFTREVETVHHHDQKKNLIALPRRCPESSLLSQSNDCLIIFLDFHVTFLS